VNKYRHAVEKLTNVLECLATHPGDARERVALAYMSCAHLMAKELPEECRRDWEWIRKEVTKRGPLPDYNGEVWRGSVENTMSRARKSTAARIAKKFYELYWAVSENRPYVSMAWSQRRAAHSVSLRRHAGCLCSRRASFAQKRARSGVAHARVVRPRWCHGNTSGR
jgi:hypothetical protein